MPNKFTQLGTKVIYREVPERPRQTKPVDEKVFKGKEHAQKAAAFVVANKKSWDFYTMQTVSQIT